MHVRRVKRTLAFEDARAVPPVLYRPCTKKKTTVGTNPRLQAPLPLYFSCTFRHFAITPAAPSIQNAPPGDVLVGAFGPCPLKDRDIIGEV